MSWYQSKYIASGERRAGPLWPTGNNWDIVLQQKIIMGWTLASRLISRALIVIETLYDYHLGIYGYIIFVPIHTSDVWNEVCKFAVYYKYWWRRIREKRIKKKARPQWLERIKWNNWIEMEYNKWIFIHRTVDWILQNNWWPFILGFVGVITFSFKGY